MSPIAMIDPTMKKPTVSPMYSPNVYAAAPTIYHNPPPPSYEEPQPTWVPPAPPVQWVAPYGIAVQPHPVEGGKWNRGKNVECVCYDGTNILTLKKHGCITNILFAFPGKTNMVGAIVQVQNIFVLKTERSKCNE